MKNNSVLGGVTSCSGVFACMVRARAKRLLRLKAAIMEFDDRGIGKTSMFSCTRASVSGRREVGDGYPKTEDSEFIHRHLRFGAGYHLE